MYLTYELTIFFDVLESQSEAYWRQQAKTLVHEYEEAEGDVRKMIRELQRDREILRGKEKSEQKLREEVDFLQKVRCCFTSCCEKWSSDHHAYG